MNMTLFDRGLLEGGGGGTAFFPSIGDRIGLPSLSKVTGGGGGAFLTGPT